MTDFLKVLLAVAPHGKPAIIKGFATALPTCLDYAGIDGVDAVAVFIGQCAEESAGFQTTVEYASGKAYEGRKDLGNTQPGDGARFKGRGLVQLTGRGNYAEFTKEMANGVDYVANPERVAQFPEAAYVADRYWKTRNIGEHIKAGSTLADKCRIATKIVNGGYNGLSVRQALTKAALTALAGYSAPVVAKAAVEALVDPIAALEKAAARERVAARLKGSVAGLASLPVLAAAPTPQATTGLPGWCLGTGIALALAAAFWAFLEIRKHENAARALANAAKEA